jgi:hypothetical protein
MGDSKKHIKKGENMSAPIFVQLKSIEISNQHETIRPSGVFDEEKPGTMVAVRPCDKKYAGKTFLGMYLCDAPTGFIGRTDGEKIILEMTDYTNPAIFIPETNEIVWGYGSWWGKIESEEKLRDITDASIQDIWYVRALKQLDSLQKATP